MLQDVYKSESDTNQRNQAIGALMFAYGYIKNNWQQAVDLYTRQCSIGVNARDLAMMAATLAASGKNPVSGKQVLDAALRYAELGSARGRSSVVEVGDAAHLHPGKARQSLEVGG